ncbi:MAG: acyltransferase family protein, partial [Opitutaceae bacterium]
MNPESWDPPIPETNLYTAIHLSKLLTTPGTSPRATLQPFFSCRAISPIQWAVVSSKDAFSTADDFGSMPTAVDSNPAPQNCFDLLRLLFAGMVLWVHARLIGGFGVDGITALSRGQVNLGVVGVLGFFAISGFLVTASFSRSSSAWSYLRRRILRIFPAFYANLLITALVIAPVICLLATGGLSAYPWFGSDGAFHYIVVNAGLQIRAWKIGLPPNPDALDGALWSLALEFMCYLTVLVMGLCGALKGKRIYLLLLTAGLCAFYWVRMVLGGAPYPLVPTFVALGPMEYVVAFGMGACFWSFHDLLPPDWRIALLLGIVLLTLAKFGGW